MAEGTLEGTLLWFNEGTGIGCIRPDDEGRCLLVRGTDMVRGGGEPLEEGAEVSYEVKGGGRRGMWAIDVSGKRRYSWRDDSLERHDGKEARREYYEGL
jgi:cold shock CspA family protein